MPAEWLRGDGGRRPEGRETSAHGSAALGYLRTQQASLQRAGTQQTTARQARADCPPDVFEQKCWTKSVYGSRDSVTVSDSCRRNVNRVSSFARFFPESPRCIYLRASTQ